MVDVQISASLNATNVNNPAGTESLMTARNSNFYCRVIERRSAVESKEDSLLNGYLIRRAGTPLAYETWL